MECRERGYGIPDDVLGEIFVRYSQWSTEPLAQLQCVCKSWRALISDPCFARLHHKKLVEHKKAIRRAMHRNNNNNNNFSLVAYGCNPPWVLVNEIFTTTLSSLLLLSGGMDQDLALDRHQEHRGFWVEGCCDGLLLLVPVFNDNVFNNSLFRIWNPATRDFTSIPASPSFRGDNFPTMYGFGRGLNSNDYKVVAIKCCPRIEVEIFCMRSGCMWRTLQGLSDDAMFVGCEALMFDGNYASGAVHWLGYSRRRSNELRIIAFDLGCEEFKEIQLPVAIRKKLCVQMSVKGENICLLVGDREAHSYDIYVMTMYGVRDSWCKIYTIPDPPCKNELGPCWKTFYFMNNGRVLLQGEMDYLLIYDPKHARFAKLKVDKKLTRRSTAIHAYVPSLMPIPEAILAAPTTPFDFAPAQTTPSDFAPSNISRRQFSLMCFSFALFCWILCRFLPKFLYH